MRRLLILATLLVLLVMSIRSGSALAALWNHSFLGESRAAGARSAWAPMTGDEMTDLMAFLQTSHRAR